MIVYRICAAQFAEDLTGTGSRLYGGRWTPKGFPVLYAASNPSLALLELYVHIRNSTPPSLKLIKISIEDEYLSEMVLTAEDLPFCWRDNPAPLSLQETGRKWIEESGKLVMRVPSSVIQEDTNCIIDVNHRDFGKAVSVLSIKDCPLDRRLI